MRLDKDRPGDPLAGPKDAPAAGAGRAVTAIVALLLAGLALMMAVGIGGDGNPKDGVVVTDMPTAAVKPAKPASKAATTPTTYVRIEWYEPFDPRATNEIFGRVEDQYGCKWWTRISGGKYEYSQRAYREDGYPDCPPDAMPRPYVDFLEKGDDATRDGITVVSRREVKSGDRELVEYFRQRRDEAAAGG